MTATSRFTIASFAAEKEAALGVSFACQRYLNGHEKIPPLREKLLAREHFRDCAVQDDSKCWLCWLESHVSKAGSATKPFAPKKGTASIVNACPGFKVGKQEDAHEYLRHLLDELQQAAKENSVSSQGGKTGQDEDYFPFSLFQGKFISSITCSKCGTSSSGSRG